MIKPAKGRVIVELVKEPTGAIVLLDASAKIGENLMCAKIVEPGDSEYKKGQLVACMEYSMAGVYKDLKAFEKGLSRSELTKPENQYHIVAAADIVVYDA